MKRSEQPADEHGSVHDSIGGQQHDARPLLRQDVVNIDVNVVDAPPFIELQAWFRCSDGSTKPSPEIWRLDPDSVEQFVTELLQARESALALSSMDPDRGDDLDEDLAYFEHLASLASEVDD